MNVVVMCGRLTRDPDIRYGSNGNPVARYRIAVNRRFKREGQPEADFFDCVSFGKQAEFVEKYLRQGTKINVQGSIQNDNYKGRDGQTVYRDQIVVDNVEFAESKNAQNLDAPIPRDPKSGSGYGGGQSQSQGKADAGDEGFMNIPDSVDDELPFN